MKISRKETWVMIVLLGGDSWVDRSSFLATSDFLNSPDIIGKVGIVEIVDLDLRDGYKLLKEALKTVKLLVICGGKPVALLNALGKNGKTVIKQWLSMDPENHRYLGICAGVAVAVALGFNQVKLVNDEAWRLCGISADVLIQLNCLGVDTPTHYTFHYESGPLMILSPSTSPKGIGTYFTDVTLEQLTRIQQINCERDQWVCQCCTFVNSLNQGKCGFCSESQNYRLPPLHEMVGKVAIAIFPQFFLCSVHPELSCHDSKEVFRSLLIRFLDGLS